MGSNIKETPKGTLLHESVSFDVSSCKDVSCKNPSSGLTCRQVIFYAFAQKPPWADLHQFGVE